MKEKIKQLIRYEKIKQWYIDYERVLLPATLVTGVIIDSLTFTRIHVTSAFALLFVYTLLVGACILFVQAYDARIIRQRLIWRYVRLAMPLIIQFFFGALLSGIFIFYIFSGTIFVSWPFFLLLVLLMVGNDVFREYYLKFPVQMSVYFFILFGLSSIVLPFVTHRIGIVPFVGAAVVSALLFMGYVALLNWIVPTTKTYIRMLIVMSSTIILILHGAYLIKIIPPIPLALRSAYVAHDVARSGGAYTITKDSEHFLEKLTPTQSIAIDPGERVYVYTAIFAPNKFSTQIIHHWRQYDDQTGAWVTRDRLTFSLTGARQQGFRGFSVKSTVPYGKWRVDVETPNGQVLGRVRFRVVEKREQPVLETVVEE